MYIGVLVILFSLNLLIIKLKNIRYIFFALLITVFLFLLLKIIRTCEILNIINQYNDVVLLFIAESFLCYVLHKIGFFRWSAYTIVFTAEESERKLLFHFIIFSIIITLLTNSHIAVIVISTMLIEVSRSINIDKKKMMIFIISTNIIIEFASILSSMGSLLNLIYIKKLKIDYLKFPSLMMKPGLICLLSSMILIYFYTSKKLTNFKNNKIVNPDIYITDWKLLNICFLIVFINKLAFFTSSLYKFSIALIPIFSAGFLGVYVFKHKYFNICGVFNNNYFYLLLSMPLIMLIFWGLFRTKYISIDGIAESILKIVKFKSDNFNKFVVSIFSSSILGNVLGAAVDLRINKQLINVNISNRLGLFLCIIGNLMGSKLFIIPSLNNIFMIRILKDK